MGNLAFDISKIVDLNKTVNLDIDKNVDVNVNIDDLLATAEADAEAFGTFALAEVDAYTYVSEGEPGEVFESSGFIDALGNGSQFVQSEETIIGPISDFPFPEFISQTYTDIDDINAPTPLLTGEDNHLNEFDNAVTEPDTPIPGSLVANTPVKELEYFADTSVLEDGDVVIIQAEYLLSSPFEVELIPPDGDQPDMDGDGEPGQGNVTLHIPAGSLYEVEFLVDPVTGELEAKEFEYISGNPEFRYDDTHQDVFPIDVYVQTGEEILGTGISDWAFEALYSTMGEKGGTPGEAFAYAESTSAVDLNNDEVLATADVI